MNKIEFIQLLADSFVDNVEGGVTAAKLRTAFTELANAVYDNAIAANHTEAGIIQVEADVQFEALFSRSFSDTNYALYYSGINGQGDPVTLAITKGIDKIVINCSEDATINYIASINTIPET